jgi:hypothetical protein
MRHRLHSICPYFAMFPETFAAEHITAWTEPGNWVLDPFSGRGTTLFQGLLMDRRAVATDTNPVAYCLTAAKAALPTLADLLRELDQLAGAFGRSRSAARRAARKSLPEFFGRAFYWTTLEQVLFLRATLCWRDDPTHTFIAALVLGCLHGEMGKPFEYFSNQMPRTISTKPAYSLRYWRTRGLYPRKRDVFAILRQRAEYRLARGAPSGHGVVALADARDAAKHFPFLRGAVRAVITSPPYFDATNFEEDQWLRLWFLGHEPRPTYRRLSADDRHTSRDGYWRFLREAWTGIAPLLTPEAVLVCRMGGRGLSGREVKRGFTEGIRHVFPHATPLRPAARSAITRRQTDTFRPGSLGCRYEYDFVYRLGTAALAL